MPVTKMKMKTKYMIFIISMMISRATAQKKIIDDVAERVRYYMTINYNPDKGFMNDSCINTIVYMKFKITGKNIDKVDFSLTSPVQMKEALVRAVAATNKQWNLTAGELKQAIGKTFILPVIIYYQAGCSPMLLTMEMLDEKNLKIPPNPDNYFHYALKNMLNFEKGKKPSMMDCTIINPIIFSNYQ